MPEQILSKGKHINNGSPTAEISTMTALFPMSSHASNNLSLKMTFLMLKRTICIERKAGSFCLWLTESDASTGFLCSHFLWDIQTHKHTSPPLKKICYPLKLFAILHWSLPSRTNTTHLWISLTSLMSLLWGKAEGPTKYCYQSRLQIKRSPASFCHDLIVCLYPFPSLPFSWEVLWATPWRTHFQFFFFPPSGEIRFKFTHRTG